MAGFCEYWIAIFMDKHFHSIETERPLPFSEAYEPLRKEEVSALLAYVLSYPTRLSADFLRSHNISPYGTKEILERRLAAAIEARTISVEEVADLLDDIEGWGNHHIYLYKADRQSTELWRSLERVRELLDQRQLIHLLNCRKPVILPRELELSTIQCSRNHVRMQWVELREWLERAPEDDSVEGDREYVAYVRRSARGVTSFDWDLISGHAALMIQRIASGGKYVAVRDLFERELEPLVRIKNFERVRLSRSIAKIEESSEALRRQYAHSTLRGGQARFTSASRRSDTFEDQQLEKARAGLGGETLPILGNLYWKPSSGGLDRAIHVKLYAKDQRMAIFGACTEREVRYLLSRIRYHCA